LNNVHSVFSLFQFKAHCKWNAGVEDVVDHRIFERAVGVVGTSFTAAVDLAREASLRRDDFVFGLIVRIETVRSVIVVIVAFVHSTTDRSYGRYAVTLCDTLIAARASAAETGITHRITSERARAVGAAAANLNTD